MGEKVARFARRPLIWGTALCLSVAVLCALLFYGSPGISASETVVYLFESAILTDGGSGGGVLVTGRSSTNSYYSPDGTIGSELRGDVFTNGIAEVSGHSEIEGTLWYVVDAIVDGSSYVRWSEPADEEFDLHVFPLPELFAAIEASNDNAQLPVTSDKGRPLFDPPGSWNMVLDGRDSALLEPGSYLIDSLVLAGGSELIVAPNVRIYVRGNAEITGGSTVNGEGAPGDLLLVAGLDAIDPAIETTGGAEISARLYAPDGLAHLDSRAVVRGSLVSRRAVLEGRSQVLWDEVWLGEYAPSVDVFSPQDGWITAAPEVTVSGEIHADPFVTEAFLVSDGVWRRLSLDADGRFSETIELDEGENSVGFSLLAEA